MKTFRPAVPALLSVLLLPAAAQTQAQQATLNDCQAIQDRLARYACYDNWDAASGTVRQSAPAPRPSAPPQQGGDTAATRQVPERDSAGPAAPAADTPAPSVDAFGRSTARVVQGEDGASELVDAIAALEQLGPNMWLITLSGGQQWKQMLSKRYNLEVGDEVRIYSTRWGSSYRLSSERVGGYIQVERVDALTSTPPAVAPAPRQQESQQAPAPAPQQERSLLGRLFDRDSAEEEQDVETAVATAPAPAAAVEGFGRTESSARLVGGEDGKQELVDTVADLKQLGPNLWLITLESGQQWQQMISKRYALEVGDEVRIYPTRWGGSFRLAAERVGSYIQVERVD